MTHATSLFTLLPGNDQPQMISLRTLHVKHLHRVPRKHITGLWARR